MGLASKLSLTATTGAQASGLPSVYDRFLFRRQHQQDMGANEPMPNRVSSAINSGEPGVDWSQVTADVPNVLGGTPRPTK